MVMYDKVGTLGYLAPAVLMANKDPDGNSDYDVGYNQKSDLFSIGVITYILLCGKKPIEEADQATLTKNTKEFYSHEV